MVHHTTFNNAQAQRARAILEDMIKSGAERLNAETDCGFIVEWMHSEAQTEECKAAVTEAALRLNIDTPTA